MKDFYFSSAVNPLAARRSLISLQGHRVPLPGASSYEPMLRGCNQVEWLEQLVRMGLRHLIVPLNGPEEDTCLFARRHPGWAIRSGESTIMPKIEIPDTDGPTAAPVVPVDPAAPKPPTRPTKKKATTEVLYDLQHRDEGAFTRIQFLLSAAQSAGVMVGFTLFNVWPANNPGPLHRGANVQGIALEDLLRPQKKQQAADQLAALEAAMAPCIDWIAAEIRGRAAVWVQAFRGLPDIDPTPEESFEPLRQIEFNLTKKLATGLTRPAEDAAKARSGPWVVTRADFNWSGMDTAHRAPFDMCRELLVDNQNVGRVCSADDFLLPESPLIELPAIEQRRPALCSYVMSDRDEYKSMRRFAQSRLWRSAVSGKWPIVPGGFEKGNKRHWFFSAKMAEFFKQWAGKGYFRPAPEILEAATTRNRMTPAAGTDGCGRYFVFFEETPKRGVEDSIPPGCDRF